MADIKAARGAVSGQGTGTVAQQGEAKNWSLRCPFNEHNEFIAGGRSTAQRDASSSATAKTDSLANAGTAVKSDAAKSQPAGAQETKLEPQVDYAKKAEEFNDIRRKTDAGLFNSDKRFHSVLAFLSELTKEDIDKTRQAYDQKYGSGAFNSLVTPDWWFGRSNLKNAVNALLSNGVTREEKIGGFSAVLTVYALQKSMGDEDFEVAASLIRAMQSRNQLNAVNEILKSNKATLESTLKENGGGAAGYLSQVLTNRLREIDGNRLSTGESYSELYSALSYVALGNGNDKLDTWNRFRRDLIMIGADVQERLEHDFSNANGGKDLRECLDAALKKAGTKQ